MDSITQLALVNLVGVFVVKLTCLGLGYLMVRMGWVLIDKGTTGQFRFKASLSGFKADLASVSPGLLFVVLGAWLIGFSLYVDKSVKLTQTTNPSPDPPVVALPKH